MAKMDRYKKITRAGGVSIPAEVRRAYGIEGGERVNIAVNAKGVIEIKRIVGSCVFCQSDESLVVYKGRYICKTCQGEIGGL